MPGLDGEELCQLERWHDILILMVSPANEPIAWLSLECWWKWELRICGLLGKLQIFSSSFRLLVVNMITWSITENISITTVCKEKKKEKPLTLSIPASFCLLKMSPASFHTTLHIMIWVSFPPLFTCHSSPSQGLCIFGSLWILFLPHQLLFTHISP